MTVRHIEHIIADLACNSWTTPSQNVTLDVDVASRSATGIIVRRTQQKQLVHKHPKRKTIDLARCKKIKRILENSDKYFTKSLKQIYYKDKLNQSITILFFLITSKINIYQYEAMKREKT